MTTTQAKDQETPFTWKEPNSFWFMLIGIGVLLVLVYYENLSLMVQRWNTSPEYGYGYLIPLITVFLIWQKKNSLERIHYDGSWLGVFVVAVGIVLFYIGDVSTVYTISQYSLIIVLTGIALALTGRRGIREIWPPLLLLVFMVPLPAFLLANLSASLQLFSSQIGVALIRLFGIAVFLEGNVIDLGTYKLQVVEACSGLRYLFPLMSLAFITVYLSKQAFWKKAVVFLSSIPITVGMNSFRIGIIGVLVEYWGKSMAEGFLHFFEGWIIFVVCLAILFGEMWLLSRMGKNRRSFTDILSIDFPSPASKDARFQYRAIPKSLWGALIVLALAVPPVYVLDKRQEIVSARTEFSVFPMVVGGWNGKRQNLEQVYLDALKLDDYLLADFENDQNDYVNLYIAYYSSQTKGEAIHSPRSCIPGGGWQITQMSPYVLEGVTIDNVPLRVNRLIIEKGENRQLVYYWFQQRGRVITNEYVVKWYLLLDAITRNRTDGSLVRLTTVMKPGEDPSNGDRRLLSFAKSAVPKLQAYIPE